MDSILSTFSNLDTLHQVFWVCAVLASAVFVVQFILTIMGMDHSDVDVDFDGADTMDLGGGLNLFTIKNLVGFFMGFGWAGICFSECISSQLLLTLVAILAGCLFVTMFVFIYKQTRKLDRNGAFDIQDCLGQTASVYIRIPEGGKGKGKVQISINGSVQELDALTDEDMIPTGQNVKITEIVDKETVKVINNQFNLVI